MLQVLQGYIELFPRAPRHRAAAAPVSATARCCSYNSKELPGGEPFQIISMQADDRAPGVITPQKLQDGRLASVEPVVWSDHASYAHTLPDGPVLRRRRHAATRASCCSSCLCCAGSGVRALPQKALCHHNLVDHLAHLRCLLFDSCAAAASISSSCANLAAAIEDCHHVLSLQKRSPRVLEP